MIGYITVGTNDLDRASKFYDALLGELGAQRGFQGERFVSWSTSPTAAGFGVIKPFNGEPATSGNGAMTALAVGNAENVHKLHAKALELGGTCEGAPGPRGDGAFYCGYVRDLDGNKLNLFCMGS
jgi:catechol 2,3-dioxygenase-like lactoylglutathione lyase family enzyme